ncbi:LOW QUALITY PROTEIN: hypothetical protein QTO34_007437 [Cnephaeus nilssonii]|uniref:Uncharacterized protein n=1 Tax=Cnephaeus nilssonii TaxID=3371016 RepID=A0AA40HK88_CNENI|nr:LOW QUALITY PROTEIN: hypothetical protein QTO34_007437 [Eptesicus nilssonii]
MERGCQPPAPALVLVRAGLLLLLLGPAGCSGAGDTAAMALPWAAPPDPGAPCAASASCPSGGPRPPRQVAPTQPPQGPTTKGPTTKGPTTKGPPTTTRPPTTLGPQGPTTTMGPTTTQNPASHHGLTAQ